MIKKQKTFKEKFSETIFAKGEFYIKLSLTLFFIAVYLILFICFDGITFFERENYTTAFKNDPFQVHVIDVENGDSILIRLPDGRTMLIDTGEERYYERVASYIRQFNHYEKNKGIDYLVLTHEDSDHIGSGKKIIENFGVKRIFRPKLYSLFEKDNLLNENDYRVSTSLTYDNIIKSAYKNKCELNFSQNGIIINASDCTIEFLSPFDDLFNDSNNDSAVLMISYQNKKFLFAGDAEKEAEEKLVEKYGSKLKADVLKVGHHGSYTSSSQLFLNYVKPEKAIISSSGTSSSLPNFEVVERLKENNIEIYATGNMGHFAFSVKDQQIKFSKAEKNDNFLALVFGIFIILILMIWHYPIKKINIASFNIKKQ